jgi:superfamily II helicase
MVTKCTRHIQAKQAMYVQRNFAARSRKHCYRGKTIIVTYSERVYVCV